MGSRTVSVASSYFPLPQWKPFVAHHEKQLALEGGGLDYFFLDNPLGFFSVVSFHLCLKCSHDGSREWRTLCLAGSVKQTVGGPFEGEDTLNYVPESSEDELH